jgi:hypothetical protein
MLVTAQLRPIAGTRWAAKRYLDMDRFGEYKKKNLLTAYPSYLRNGTVTAYTAFN